MPPTCRIIRGVLWARLALTLLLVIGAILTLLLYESSDCENCGHLQVYHLLGLLTFPTALLLIELMYFRRRKLTGLRIATSLDILLSLRYPPLAPLPGVVLILTLRTDAKE